MKLKLIKKFKNQILIFIIILLVVSNFYLYFEDTALTTTLYTVKNEKIPKEFDGFKIAQLSDFHNSQSTKLSNDIIKNLKQTEPDAIFITGDLIDANKIDINTSIELINQIKDIAPIYYVTGNHEGSTNKYSELKQGLVDNDVIILENTTINIKKGNDSINILGIDDPTFSGNEIKTKESRMKLILSKIEYDENKYSILLSHRPELLSVYASVGIDLVFSGHAHGGQIRVPFIGGLYSPGQGTMPNLTEGIHQKDETTMVISRGLGNSTFPFRINNRPELVIVTLEC